MPVKFIMILICACGLIFTEQAFGEKSEKNTSHSDSILSDATKTSTYVVFAIKNAKGHYIHPMYLDVKFWSLEKDDTPDFILLDRKYQTKEACRNKILDVQFEYLKQGIDWPETVKCFHYDWDVILLENWKQPNLEYVCEKLIWNYDPGIESDVRHLKNCKELEILRYGVPTKLSKFREHKEKQHVR